MRRRPTTRKPKAKSQVLINLKTNQRNKTKAGNRRKKRRLPTRRLSRIKVVRGKIHHVSHWPQNKIGPIVNKNLSRETDKCQKIQGRFTLKDEVTPHEKQLKKKNTQTN